MSFQLCGDGPIFFGLEAENFAFALDDHAQSDSLNAAGGNSSADLVPEQRADLITDEAVQDSARLLRIDDVLIDPAGFSIAARIAFGVISLNRTR